MSNLKLIFPIVSLFYLLSSCTTSNNISNQSKSNIKNCPQAPEELSKIEITKAEDVYTAFNYQISEIVANEDTINFQSPNYDFVFCRGNNNWIVQPGTLNQEENNNLQAELANPSYKTIKLNQKSYQYRVILEPNPFPDLQVEAQKVIFELILPDTQQPKRQVLYTLEQTEQAQAGIQLGLPNISKTLIWSDRTLEDNQVDRLFWSISPEQGEGNGGIATIVSYNQTTGKITLIQPEEIARQQINDFVISQESSNLTFWLATQMSGEGNPYLPSMGLVAYRTNIEDLTQGSTTAYHGRNSPIIGAIPTKLNLEAEKLWLGTGNGICQITWQTIDNFDSWDCWRFALMANLSSEEIPVYRSLLAKTPATQIKSEQNTIEVLWWLPQNNTDRDFLGRYEVRYEPGFTFTLEDQGATPWTELYPSSWKSPSWNSPVYWVGQDWSWNGNVFVRGFDQVPPNYFGGGFIGIGKQEYEPNSFRFDMNAIRGDLELLKLSSDSTTVKYYSGWINHDLLEPYLTIIPADKPSLDKSKEKSNPLKNLGSW